MTKIIGLTGGIGSGKTMVAEYIKSLGIPVYIADDEARKLMMSDKIIKAISNEFGNGILDNGKLNREKLAQLVFNNPEKLQKLNNIVHPEVKKHFYTWVEKHKNYPFVVKEAAILFESGSNKYCDAVITITSPIETRLQRVIERDNTDRESVLKRMQNQWTDEQRIAKSDYVIHNLSVDATKKQVDEILKLLKNQ
ncbi:dephospho-CoA kinase [Flavobacterium paronense]|uniref:Dephospho-CoA kinase n=1 Tax=Flavobacterium paronense TaxID=1392775 RepID=A0ABV5GGL5_9FLAO|nr:dephospho-CoA kinase [Flavobacterium paronense]MDN3675885.1 dephospho-CoA kinase [Flavobacterium paronense]MDN3677156.1 dephospho-CoA kinase [Flavobacterium paronense]